MKVFGASLSPFVRKVLLVLDIKGLEHEQEQLSPGAFPEGFEKISPLSKIPAFQDGDVTIADSSVISAYLEEKYPNKPVLPKDVAERARARWFEEYGDSKLVELLGRNLFFQRIVKPLLFKQESDEALVEKSINELLPPVLDYLENELPDEGFLFGELGLADISIGTHFINGSYAGYDIDATRWPKLAKFIETFKAHPIVANRLQGEQKILEIIGAA